LVDPSLFARASGSPQEDNASFANFYVSWTELYDARFGVQRKLPDLQRILATHRPVGHRFLGGDVSLMLAVAARATH
jgi:hypothetical protein